MKRSTARHWWLTDVLGVVVATLLVASCGSPATPGPDASPSAPATPAGVAATTSSAAATPTPSPTYADTLRIGWQPGGAPYGFRGALSQLDIYNITLGTVVFSGLYRYDATFGAIPDLADGPCLPQADPKVIRCRLIEATFHDGTPVTADDVAYSYGLYAQPATAFSWLPHPETVRVVDARTVDFVLASVDPSFLSGGLASPILPHHAVEASYADFVAATKGLKAADLTKLADAIDTGRGDDPPVCTLHLDEAAALLDRLGVPLYREDFTRDEKFDTCGWVGTASGLVRAAADSLGTTGLAAVAAAYPDLRVDREPIGTGPYRFVSENANRIHLEAWPGYHGGTAATRFIDFVPAKGDGSDLLDGALDIYQVGFSANVVTLGPAFQATAPSRGVRVATLPGPGYYALHYNVRPGRLFADLALRNALQLCVDLPRDVDAATGGAGIPAYGPVMPGTWAWDPTLPQPARDVAAARALIEGAGWKPGADGVYAKDGSRLAAEIFVRGDVPARVKLADLIAAQARDCGMDLRSRPMEREQLVDGLFVYPHLIPGTKTPFDLFLGGYLLQAGDVEEALSNFVSTNISDADHPDGYDWTGFSDPVLDTLVKQAMATYDRTQLLRLYRQAQQEIAAQQPYLFLGAATTYDVVRSAVTTVDGPLDLTKPNWAWQPERLVVTEGVR